MYIRLELRLTLVLAISAVFFPFSSLGLRCCAGFSLAVASKGYTLVAVHTQAFHQGRFSCCRARGSRVCGFSSYGTWAL